VLPAAAASAWSPQASPIPKSQLPASTDNPQVAHALHRIDTRIRYTVFMYYPIHTVSIPYMDTVCVRGLLERINLHAPLPHTPFPALFRCCAHSRHAGSVRCSVPSLPALRASMRVP